MIPILAIVLVHLATQVTSQTNQGKSIHPAKSWFTQVDRADILSMLLARSESYRSVASHLETCRGLSWRRTGQCMYPTECARRGGNVVGPCYQVVGGGCCVMPRHRPFGESVNLNLKSARITLDVCGTEKKNSQSVANYLSEPAINSSVSQQSIVVPFT